MSGRHLLGAGVALVLAVLVTGCGSALTSRPSVTNTPSVEPSPASTGPATVASVPEAAADPTGSPMDVDRWGGPPPLIMKDFSPANLALSLYLHMGGYDAAGRNITELVISFSSGGRSVQFVGDEGITCNGVPLQRGGAVFDGKVPTETLAGKPVTCALTSGQSSVAFGFTAPVALAILSPREQARVPRSARTPVEFRVGGHNTTFYVIALGQNTKAWSYPAGPSPTQAILDTSAFLPGPGFIALSQDFRLPDLHGSGFQSVTGRGQAAQQYAVTWT